MNWIKGNKLILLFMIIVVLILGYPLLMFGIGKSFYLSLDPDIVYTTNALLYTKTAIVSYFDHPGTPTILLFSYMFVPLRLISKYILHQGFIEWSFNNYQLLTFYLRIFQLFVSGVTLFIFLKLVESMVKLKILILFAVLLIFSSQILFKSIIIAPETLSLFFAVVWFAIFLRFVEKHIYSLNLLMALISGFAFANKFTNLFLIISTIFLPFFISGTKAWRKVLMSVANIAVFILAFIIGIKPVIYNLKYIIGWGGSLFTHTEKYGGGAMSVFDLGVYSHSFLSLTEHYPAAVLLVILTAFLCLSLLSLKRIKANDPFIYLFASSFLGFLIFAKYPVIHYNYTNLLLMIFCTIYFVSKLKIIWVKLMIPLLVVVFVFTSFSYFGLSRDGIAKNSGQSLNKIFEDWTTVWSADIFREQLNATEKLETPKTP